MSKHGKKYSSAKERIDKLTSYSAADALAKIKELAYVSFDETIDVDVNLGIDPTKGEQAVRGSLILPHGSGKRVKIAVFAKGDHAEAAQKAGADVVGGQDLVEKIEGGWLDFDSAIATPDMMGLVGKVAKILGPRGKLPNQKLGTVTFDVARVVTELKGGRSFFKNDKGGLVHFSIGKKSFDVQKLKENLHAFIKALASAKPATSKGKFIRKITVSSTMGVGVSVSPEDVV